VLIFISVVLSRVVYFPATDVLYTTKTRTGAKFVKLQHEEIDEGLSNIEGGATSFSPK
jgi:hypothetical protein